MKNRISLLLAFIILAPSLFLFGTCEDSNEPLNLNSVQIPEYDDEDYLKMLKSDNPELVYNAICYFIPYAPNYATYLSIDTLSVDKAANASDSLMLNEIKLAKDVYTLVAKQLQSDNDWILGSALRFFAKFGAYYNKPDELIGLLSKVNVDSKSVRLEFVNAVMPLVYTDISKLNSITSRYYEYPSWLESRYAFSILPFVDFKLYFLSYSGKFNALAEYDKLLFINGLSRDRDSGQFMVFDDEVLGFILASLDGEKSDKVKYKLFTCLSHASDHTKVLQWLKLNHSKLKDISSPVFDYCIRATDTLSLKMFSQLLSQNYFSNEIVCKNSTDMFYWYYSSIKDPENYDYSVIGVRDFMSEILSYPEYRKCWDDYLAEIEKSKPDPRFVAEQNVLLENLRKQTFILFDKYNMDSTYRVKYLDRIDYLKTTF